MPSREETTVRYQLDPSASRFNAQVSAIGLLSAFGHSPLFAIRDFSGDARFDGESLSDSRLQLRLNPRSFELQNDVKPKDRDEILRVLRADVLESDKYPDIQYECNAVSGSIIGNGRYWVVLDGMLTLHGVTWPQKVVASLVVNDGVCRASGEFTLRQSDYNIKLVSAMGGGLKVKDDVKCAFDIVARRVE